MKVQYMISVVDKNDVEFMKEFGEVIHVAKLRNLVVIECESGKGMLEVILKHPNVTDGRESRIFHLV